MSFEAAIIHIYAAIFYLVTYIFYDIQMSFSVIFVEFLLLVMINEIKHTFCFRLLVLYIS